MRLLFLGDVVGRSGRDVSLPMQLSMRMVWCGVFTT